MTPQSSSRDRILARVRGALTDVSNAAETTGIARDYLTSHTPTTRPRSSISFTRTSPTTGPSSTAPPRTNSRP